MFAAKGRASFDHELTTARGTRKVQGVKKPFQNPI